MKVSERAAQVWPVLAWAARNRQILTYDLLAKLIRVPRPALGQLLEPIQSYCLLRKLPPLSILVVSQQTGMPGTGFIAAHDIPANQAAVFALDWLEIGCPAPEDFEAASAQLPSNGIPAAVNVP